MFTCMQVIATFCIGPNYRDGLDGMFCDHPIQPQTNISATLNIGSTPVQFFASGPWNDSSVQSLVQVCFPEYLNTPCKHF